MGTVSRIGKNTFFLFLNSFVQKILAFILMVIIARTIGVEDFGLYSFAFSFVIMFTVVSDFGVNSFLVREIAKGQENIGEQVGNAIFFKILTAIFALILIYLTISLVSGRPFVILLVTLTGVSMVLDSLAGLFRSLFVAFERMEFEFLVGSLYKIAVIVFSLYFLMAGAGVFGLVVAVVMASALNLVLSFFISSSKIMLPKLALSPTLIKKIFLASLPFCFTGIFMAIYSNIDMVMINYFKGNIATGLYSSAYRIISTIGFIAAGFTTAVFPVMTRFFSQANKSFLTVYEKSLKYLMLAIMPIAVGVFFTADRILFTVFGSEFIAAAPTLKILVFGSVFTFISFLSLNFLNSSNREKTAVMIAFVTLMINVIANYFLIPLYSLEGAAVALVISELVFVLASFYFIFRLLGRISFSKIFFKPFVASAVIAVFIYLFQFLRLYELIVVSGAIYFIVLLLVRAFDELDWKIFRALTRKEKT